MVTYITVSEMFLLRHAMVDSHNVISRVLDDLRLNSMGSRVKNTMSKKKNTSKQVLFTLHILCIIKQENNIKVMTVKTYFVTMAVAYNSSNSS